MIGEQVREDSLDRREESAGAAEQVLLTLAQQRVRAFCSRVRLELTIAADLLAGCAQQRKDPCCEHEDEQESVATFGRSDRSVLEAESEVQVLLITKGEFGCEAATIRLHDEIRVAGESGREAPGFLHRFVVDADHVDRKLRLRQEDILHFAGVSVREDQVLDCVRQAALPRHLEGSTNANDEVPTEVVSEEREELGICKAAIGEQGDLDSLRQAARQDPKNLILVAVSPPLQALGLDRLPHEWRRAAVLRDEVDRNSRLAVGRVVGPVERDHDLRSLGHEPWNRSLEASFQNKAGVAEQPIDLLDPVLRTCASHAGHCTTDLRDAEALGEDDSDRRERDRPGPLLVESWRQEIHDELDYLPRFDREITDAFLLRQPPKPPQTIRLWRRAWPRFSYEMRGSLRAQTTSVLRIATDTISSQSSMT